MLQTLKNKLAIEYALLPIRVRKYTCRWKGHEYTLIITRAGGGYYNPWNRCKWCGKETSNDCWVGTV